MSSMGLLKRFDKSQLFRFFVDGRFQKKYSGWLGYEEKERGSVQGVLNGFAFALDHFDLSQGLRSTYLLDLHRTCMLGVNTRNPNTSPGDIRHLSGGMPLFAGTTSLQNIVEILEMRRNDGTVVFHTPGLQKTANELDAETVFAELKQRKKLSYRPWFPIIDATIQRALDRRLTLHEYYEAKHLVQMEFVEKVEEIVSRFNKHIVAASTPDDRLWHIALLVRDLELLHPFPDGNCRTVACVMLNHLLLYYDLCPTILHNPNLDGELGLDQWIKEIKTGMERTKVLLADPHARVSQYSILDAAPGDTANFLRMAQPFVSRIEGYREIFLTSRLAQEFSGGRWIGCSSDLHFAGLSVTASSDLHGHIFFPMSLKEWAKAGRNVKAELSKLVRTGIRAIVVDDAKHASALGIPTLVVADLPEALESIAGGVRTAVNPKTVLITGTEGKTGSKIQLHHVLKGQTRVHAVLNSANLRYPVLRSLADLEEDDRVELTEVAAACGPRRAAVVAPDLIFFTNIGAEHMQIHKTVDALIAAKSALVIGLKDGGKCIANSSTALLDPFLASIQSRRPLVPVLTYGFRASDTARLRNQVFDEVRRGWHVEADIDGLRMAYFLPLFQEYSPLMSVGVLLAVKALGYDVARAAGDFATVKPFETMGLVHTVPHKKGTILLYDQSRRASISGVRSAFGDLRNLRFTGKHVALLGCVGSFEDNDWTRRYHQELAELINRSGIRRLYTTGPNMRYVHDGLENPSILVKHCEDKDELYHDLVGDLEPGDLLFIMGYMRLKLDLVAAKFVGPPSGSAP